MKNLDETAPLAAPTDPPPPPLLAGRYQRRQWLGSGGMGDVWRVWDTHLGRAVAMKRARSAESPALRARFVQESRITARLNHPNVIAVYDAGDAEGNLWYTMREVPEARTLDGVVEAERGSAEGLQRGLLRIALVCDALAHAHQAGVIHRDVKPANVLVGAADEVVLIDWGIARGGGRGEPDGPLAGSEGRTGDGGPLGTLGFAPPEQLLGLEDQHGPWSDVHAVGAMLQWLVTGSLTGVFRAEHPPQLVALARACLDPVPARRPEGAANLARSLRGWVERAAAEQRAASLVTAAGAEVAAGAEGAAGVEGADPAERAGAAARARVRAEGLLYAALEVAPGYDPAHGALAVLCHAEAVRAEEERREVDALAWEARLRRHDRGAYARWLANECSVTLEDLPSGRAVWHRRWVREGVRRRPGPPTLLGTTPLREVPAPGGSAVLEIEGERPVVLPVVFPRGEHWRWAHPDGQRLDLDVALAADEVLVPGGWAWLGGDPFASDAWPRHRRWIEPFVVRRHPVTCGEYLAWLNALVDEGRGEDAERWAPFDQAGPGAPQRRVWERDALGHYRLGRDSLGNDFHPDHPVTLVDWFAATAFAADAGRRTGLPWRLPHEAEREKAARGVDGRFFPWGDRLEPGMVANGDSHQGPWGRFEVGRFPDDCSVYGVRGLCGNVREWCLNAWAEPHEDGSVLAVAPSGDPTALRALRGGAWSATAALSRPAGRFGWEPHRRVSSVGFRLVRGVNTGLPRAGRPPG